MIIFTKKKIVLCVCILLLCISTWGFYFFSWKWEKNFLNLSEKTAIQWSLVSLWIQIFNASWNLENDISDKTILVGSRYLPDAVEKSLIGAHIWDTREIVSPGTLQWSGRVMQAIKNEQILPEYDIVVPAKNYFGSVFLDRPWADYPWLQSGDEVQVAWYGTGFVIDIVRWVVQIEVPNIYSPFYGQKLQIGASWDQWNRRLTVKEIQGDTMTLHVQNMDSPFVWKQVEPWFEWMQDGKMMRVEQMFNDYILVSFDETKETKKYRIVVKNIE